MDTDLWLALEPQTKSQYDSYWVSYVRFSTSILKKHYSQVSVQEFPQFVVHLHNKKVKAKSIRSMVSAIAFNYEARYLPPPTKSFAVKKLLLAYTKSDSPPVVRNPILQSVLLKVIRAIPTLVEDRYEAIMLISVFTLMYAALLRISEVAYTPKSNHNLRRKDVLIAEHSRQKVVNINMKSCKFSKGRIYPMQISTNFSCPEISPVKAYEVYSAIRPKAAFAFVGQDGRPLTPTYVRKSLRFILTSIKHKSLEFNTHSFRIGRATDMYVEGYSDLQISKAGRWNSKAFLKYIKPQLIKLA